MNVILEFDDKPIGIPYFRDPQDAESHSYINLRKEPHRITELPELRGCPECLEFVKGLNAPNSAFETLGCIRFWSREPDTGRFLLKSYVPIAFANRDRISTQNSYVELFEQFQRFGSADDLVSTNVLVVFEVQPAVFAEESIEGFILNVWILCLGESVPEAKKQWDATLTCLGDFLRSQL